MKGALAVDRGGAGLSEVISKNLELAHPMAVCKCVYGTAAVRYRER